MQLTPNYNLKKPEGTDQVDIQDFNDNADIMDAELKKKADSTGGDVSNMTIKTLEEPTSTQFPVPEAGESSKTFFGKVRKFMNDFKSWNTGVCMIGQIVNNCVTNNDKLPLSAAQGKVLMDLYSVLNTNLAGKNPTITYYAEQNNNIVINPTTWVDVFRIWLPGGLYIVKYSAIARKGVSGLSLETQIDGSANEQQTDRAPENNPGVRGAIGTNIYYVPGGGTFVGRVYVNHSTSATIENNLKILKFW